MSDDQFLIKSGVDIDARSTTDYTPLHYASDYGRNEVVEVIATTWF